MCFTPAAAAAPSAARPAFELPIFIATPIGGGGVSTSPRKPVRWRARSSRFRQAGTTSTNRNSAAFSSASCEARSIAFSSIAFSGLRVTGMAAARRLPTSYSSASRARSSTMSENITVWPASRRLASPSPPRCTTRRGRAPFHARVAAALEGVPFELVIVDDGSRDGTRPSWRGWPPPTSAVKVVTLSRNFGHQAALTAALEHTSGDVVVMLDGDLQDPPELIPEMLDRWRDGADVVYAVRSRRQGETAFKRATASWFYRLFRRMADIDLTPESSRRLPADGPPPARRAAGDAGAQPLPARDERVGGLHADRGHLRARAAQRRRDQVHAAAG